MIKERIQKDTLAARKAKDAPKVEALQAVKAATELISKEPTEQDYIVALRKVIKQYEETLDGANKAGREDLYKEIQGKLFTLDMYLPKQLTEDEVSLLVVGVINGHKLGLEKKNMGNIVKLTVAASNGATDSKTVSAIVNKLIAATVA